MKLDAKLVRYLTSDDYRVLAAVEIGSRNHEIVPTTLIAQIAALKKASIHSIISTLCRNNLIQPLRSKSNYDGYRLTYGGYDYLALKTFSSRNTVYAVGSQIGVGKESDVHLVSNDSDTQFVLKIQRLGRTSFRDVKEKRDYLRHRGTGSWLYLSRLAAIKEYAFMKILYQNNFPVPKPIDQSRHCIVMQLVCGYPLAQVHDVEDIGKLYSTLMSLILRLANCGLIHGDFNEFNIIIQNDNSPILIDFPQMVSVSHKNAEMLFNRDVRGVRKFFERRFAYVSTLWPVFQRDVVIQRVVPRTRKQKIADRLIAGDGESSASGSLDCNLDVAVGASGFTRNQQVQLENFMNSRDDEHSEQKGGEAIIQSESESASGSDNEFEEYEVQSFGVDLNGNVMMPQYPSDEIGGDTELQHEINTAIVQLTDELVISSDNAKMTRMETIYEVSCEELESESEGSDDESEEDFEFSKRNKLIQPFRDVQITSTVGRKKEIVVTAAIRDGVKKVLKANERTRNPANRKHNKTKTKLKRTQSEQMSF